MFIGPNRTGFIQFNQEGKGGWYPILDRFIHFGRKTPFGKKINQ
jgi:hypothetical protein